MVDDWSGHGATERLRVPSPPERGRHRLSISLCSSANGAVVLDRLIVVPAGA
jgi:hypothetical protein